MPSHSTGVSFDFTDACLRHDFGYRNTKELGLFQERKAEIDTRFYEDMKDHCATRSVFLQPRCYEWARRFHARPPVAWRAAEWEA